jgi:hypothetical protein
MPLNRFQSHLGLKPILSDFQKPTKTDIRFTKINRFWFASPLKKGELLF